MKPPIFVRELSEKERERLEAGLRSKDDPSEATKAISCYGLYSGLR